MRKHRGFNIVISILLLLICSLFLQSSIIMSGDILKYETDAQYTCSHHTENNQNTIKGFEEFSHDETGIVVLRGDKSFASQVNLPNTIYEIHNSFNLDGQSITIPQGCVLYIKGGSVYNGIIIGQDSELVLIAGTLNCKLAGSFKNESIHMEWFGIKSGKDYTKHNDTIIQTYIIPTMENIGNTLYMNPQTQLYFSKQIVFNGSYELDLKGQLCYDGPLVATAVSIGTSDSRVFGKNFTIHSVKAATGTGFYNKGRIEDNVGVCLWNLKQCNITLDEVLNFGYCVRLCGNIGGCSSNIIHFTRIGGGCYYGIHCCSYDTGWVNENSFYGKAIINYTSNPAKDVMCAIWLDARGKYSCNSNVFFDPNVENCYCVIKLTNAMYNIVHDARAEHITKSLLIEGRSKNNILYCKYWDKNGDYSSYGSNKVIKQSEMIPPLVQVFSEQIGQPNMSHYGVCFRVGGLRAQAKVNGDYVFGKIVEIADPTKDINVEFVFQQPGRFCVVMLNDDYTIKSVSDAENYILNSDVTVVPINDIIRGGYDARRISIHLSKNCKKMLVGTDSCSSNGDVVSMNVYSDNLLVDDLYTSNNNVFTLNKKVGIDAFYYKNSSDNFLSRIGTIQIYSTFDLEMKTLNLNKKLIYIGQSGCFINGTVDVTGATIYPNYNALIEGSKLVVQGIPAAGTFYFQKGKPTWSNGSTWVDANGQQIE